MRNRLMKPVIFLLACALTACSQGMQNVSPPAPNSPASAPDRIKPQDTLGGTGLLWGTLRLLLLDSSPALNGKTVQNFYIGVDEVDAVANGTAYPVATFATPYVLDLLQYQNGNALPIGQNSISAQNYSQLRFVLNTASTQIVFSDGSTMPVSWKTTGSASSAHAASGTTTTSDPNIAGAVDVSVNAPFTVASDGSITLSADFNILESLTANNNTVFVRPSMFVANGAGQVNGTVLNQSGTPVQNAVVVAVGSNGVVANTSATDASGNFNLHALKPDTYQLVIYNSYENAAGQTITASGQTNGATSFNGPTITITSGGPVSAGTIAD